MEGDFFQRHGLSIYSETDRLLPQVYEVMDIVKQHDAWLATGHLSVKESMALCRLGRSRGVNMILTHPEWYRTRVPIELQLELAGLGVLIEDVWFNIADGSVSPKIMTEHIRTLGIGRVYMATDRGQVNADSPTESMRKYIFTMLEHGLTEEEIDSAVRKVPKQIVT